MTINQQNSSWQTKKLGDLCQIELGKTPYRGNHKLWDKEMQTSNVWLSIADLLNTDEDSNTISNSKEYISNEGAKLSKIVKKGTLLASFKLTLGRMAFAGKDLYTNEAIAALTIKNEKEISKDFLYHYLIFFDWHGAVKGDIKIKGKTLNKTKLKELEVFYPESLSEQRRIVKILDEVFGKINKAKENTEKNLQNTKELFESYLQSVFVNPGKDWEEKRLGEVTAFSQGIQVGLEKHLTEPKEGHVRFIRIIDYTQNTDDIRYIPNPGEKYFVNEDDIVMVRYGTPGLIGRGKAGVIANNLFKITVERSDLSNDYLSLYLSQKDIQNYLSTRGSSTMPALNFGQLKTIEIKFPPPSKQKAIVKKLDEFSEQTKKLETIYKQKLADLEELKKSVLQKAFAGELVN